MTATPTSCLRNNCVASYKVCGMRSLREASFRDSYLVFISLRPIQSASDRSFPRYSQNVSTGLRCFITFEHESWTMDTSIWHHQRAGTQSDRLATRLLNGKHQQIPATKHISTPAMPSETTQSAVKAYDIQLLTYPRWSGLCMYARVTQTTSTNTQPQHARQDHHNLIRKSHAASLFPTPPI